MSPRRFPYGAADRPAEARHRHGLLLALGVLEYEVGQLPEWDVLAPGLAFQPSSDPEDDIAPGSD